MVDVLLDQTKRNLAQSAGAAERTDCISEEGWNFPNECPDYNTKQSSEVSVMVEPL